MLSVFVVLIAVMFCLSSGGALAKSRGGGGGGGSSTYFGGNVYGVDQDTLNVWTLPGATVTATYWWANGILWNQQTDKTTTDSNGYWKLFLSRYPGYPVDWTAGVVIKAYKHNDNDPANSYWTERTVYNRFWSFDMLLPKDKVTYVYDMLLYSNTNYVNMIIDKYQTKVGPIAAYKTLDYRGDPYSADLPWIKDYAQFTSAEHSGITGEFGETIGSRIPIYCTGEYCPDSGYPVIDSASLYGSRGTRQDVGVKPNYLQAAPEYLSYDYTKLKIWTVDRNSARNPVGDGFDWAANPPTLSGSVNLGTLVDMNTYYAWGYRWYAGSASQSLATKLTMYKDNTYHVNCIASVPASDPAPSKNFGFRFDPTTNNVILHVWCTVGTEAMTAPFSRYPGATTEAESANNLVGDGAVTHIVGGVDLTPSSNLNGQAAMGAIASGDIGSAGCSMWAGVDIPFIARLSNFRIDCSWLATWNSWGQVWLLVSGSGIVSAASEATVTVALYIELYDISVSDINPVASTSMTLCDVYYNLLNDAPGGLLVIQGAPQGSGVACNVPLLCNNMVAGHTYKVVTFVSAIVSAYGKGGQYWEGGEVWNISVPATAGVTATSTALTSVTLSY